MFWPLVLPFQLTLGLMVAFVLIATSVALAYKWRAGTVFVCSCGLAFVGFIPACTGIMELIDSRRFGVFQMATYTDVQDFRIQRYLPECATSIALEKTGMGHRAKYTITEAELRDFLDQLWNKAGNGSSTERAHLRDGELDRLDEIVEIFGDLGWPPMTQAIRLHSPVEADGGGATYYFDPSSGTAYHRAGYW